MSVLPEKMDYIIGHAFSQNLDSTELNQAYMLPEKLDCIISQVFVCLSVC